MDVVDTDVLIELLRGRPEAEAWFNSLAALPLVSGFTVMELIYGCRNTAELHELETLLTPFAVLWPSEAEMQRARALLTALHLSHGLGLIDAVIAAQALENGYALLTFNIRHFLAVPGLTAVPPYTRHP